MTLESEFPQLRRTSFAVTSPITPAYNCIAWAAGDKTRFWWPIQGAYWPPTVPKDDTIPAFISLFEQQGYTACADGSLEPGIEKVAIYADANQRVKHAARQLGTGMWTSKLGRNVDIAHELSGLEKSSYGNVVVYMARTRTP